MRDFYNKDQFEEKVDEVQSIKNKTTDEYFFKYMRIVVSFGRPTRISNYGYEVGKKLYERWKKGEELTREENILSGFLLTDICVLEEDSQIMNDLKIIYNEMVTRYKPDFPYLQEFGQKYLLQEGYMESNPNYIQSVEKMFTINYVLPDPEQVRMISTGEMPIYDEIKVCPYCGKQFGEDEVEDLFKHVKLKHDKK